MACGRLEWRAAFAQRIIPALRAYGPHLILLSSGFDGGVGDIGNSKLDAAEKCDGRGRGCCAARVRLGCARKQLRGAEVCEGAMPSDAESVG